MNDPRGHDTFAAVDLGSNSFHMVLARREGPNLVVMDRLREMVRLAAGLDAKRYLARDARERALACLQRFGQRLVDIPARNIRVVGTSALRQARDAESFIAAAEAALNHRIEIVSGMEEARLIYLGVAHSLAPSGRRLVMDIGGGSTEFIVGEGFDPLHKASLHMGCVGHSRQFFADGRLSRKRFEHAELAARLQIEPIEQRFRALDWREAIGASGTIKAVAAAVRNAGWSRDSITREGLGKLRATLIAARRLDRLDLDGVKAERMPVFPGGVAILHAAFQALGVEEMRVSDGAMREGLLHDLPGRLEHEDIRGASVERLAERFHVDMHHAGRVQATASRLFEAVRSAWGLDDEHAWQLRWAATLHEVGLDIGFGSYHKHSAYIVENTDLAGFSRDEQHQLSVLIQLHRRKFNRQAFARFDESESRVLARLAVLLRIAVVLHRGRSPRPLPEVDARADGARLRLAFGNHWLGRNALTRADLEEEARILQTAGFTLELADHEHKA
jgi:exopolyphosphatase / guanosine-5'-triphosphate,3'-diphosphate pyrophosphatase